MNQVIGIGLCGLIVAFGVCPPATSAGEASIVVESETLARNESILRIGFESGRFDVLSWRHKGVPWEITQEDSHSGVFSARSGGIFGEGTQSVLQLTYMCAEGYVRFAFRIASGPAQRELIFQIDGQPVGAWSGDQAWTEVAYPVSDGMHTFTWVCEVDPSVAGEPGAAWIDSIAITIHGEEPDLMSAMVPEGTLEDYLSASEMLEKLLPEIDANLEEKLQEEVDQHSDYIERQINTAVLTEDDVNQIHAIVDEVEAHWLNPYGFVHSDEQPPGQNELGSDNPVLLTAEYLQLLDWLGVLDGDLRERYRSEVIEMVDSLRVAPGIFCRFPLQIGGRAFETYFSHDEQQGLLMLDAIFDYELGYARELNEYGKDHLYCYDNIAYSPYDPNVDLFDLSQYSIPITIPLDIGRVFKSVYAPARQPPFIELIRLCASEEPVLFNQEWLFWALKVSTMLPQADTSSKILNYHKLPMMYKAVRDSNLPTLWKLRSLKAMADFYDSMAMMYMSDKHPLHEIHHVYFRNNDHPIERLSAFLQVENPRVPKGKCDLNCTTACDRGCSSRCEPDCTLECVVGEIFGVPIIDPVCVAECELEKLSCEADCVSEEEKCEAVCSLIEEVLDL